MSLYPRPVLLLAFVLAFASPASAAPETNASPASEQPAQAPAAPALPGSPSAADASVDRDAPAQNAECAWIGHRVVGLLWRDDVNTAREQTRFYELFGCPTSHVKLAFRCLIETSAPPAPANAEPKPAEAQQPEQQQQQAQPSDKPAQPDLATRVRACWDDPSARSATATQAIAPAPVAAAPPPPARPYP